MDNEAFFESKANQISINENIRMMKKLEIAFVDEEKWGQSSFLVAVFSRWIFGKMNRRKS